MKVNYDHEADVLHVTTDKRAATAASLLDDPNVSVELATSDGHDIVGLIVMWASSYIRSGLNAETDTVLMGRKASESTDNEDLTVYWQVDEVAPDEFMDPVGVAISQASVHLAKVLAPIGKSQ